MALTRSDINCLRRLGPPIVSFDGTCHKFTLVERRHIDGHPFEFTSTIAVNGRIRTPNGIASDLTPYRCFVHSVNQAMWAAFTAALRVGDQVELCWYQSNNTVAITKADFHADELRARIERPVGPPLEWMLDYRVGPDNTARMVRKVAHPSLPPFVAETDGVIGVLEKLSFSRTGRSLVLACDRDVANALVDTYGVTILAGGNRFRVRADWARSYDELIVLDHAQNHVLAHTFVPPFHVRAAGALAAGLYVQLRADGTSGAAASEVAELL